VEFARQFGIAQTFGQNSSSELAVISAFTPSLFIINSMTKY
jgi:hypothetical protein